MIPRTASTAASSQADPRKTVSSLSSSSEGRPKVLTADDSEYILYIPRDFICSSHYFLLSSQVRCLRRRWASEFMYDDNEPRVAGAIQALRKLTGVEWMRCKAMVAYPVSGCWTNQGGVLILTQTQNHGGRLVAVMMLFDDNDQVEKFAVFVLYGQYKGLIQWLGWHTARFQEQWALHSIGRNGLPRSLAPRKRKRCPLPGFRSNCLITLPTSLRKLLDLRSKLLSVSKFCPSLVYPIVRLIY
eukprot:scaffold91_cov173-Amphora_coffeaeformis.AAC.4